MGVPPNASQEQIKERFRFLAHAFHPDKFATPAHKKHAEEAFKKINDAYQSLSNPVRRREYDRRQSSSDSKYAEERRKREKAKTAQRRAKAEQQRREQAEARRRADEEQRKQEETEAARRRTDEEQRQRARAEAARQRAEEERRKREEAEAARRRTEKEQRKREEANAARRRAEEERRKREGAAATQRRTEMETAVCPECGKTNSGTTTLYHCQYCGHRLHDVPHVGSSFIGKAQRFQCIRCSGSGCWSCNYQGHVLARPENLCPVCSAGLYEGSGLICTFCLGTGYFNFMYTNQS